jgi:hypothetical protein
MKNKPLYVYAEIDSLITAIEHCKATKNETWEDRHRERLREIEQNLLPSGSGFDSGSTVDLERSNRDRIIINSAFHIMNECGYYDGWIHFEVIVQPTFSGIDVTVKGPFAKTGVTELKEYIEQVFYHDLTYEIQPEEVSDGI